MTRKKARCKHPNHMPLENPYSLIKRQFAHLHSQGRCRHEQVHHAIRKGCSDSTNNKEGLAHDLRKGPTGFLGFTGGTFLKLNQADRYKCNNGNNS